MTECLAGGILEASMPSVTLRRAEFWDLSLHFKFKPTHVKKKSSTSQPHDSRHNFHFSHTHTWDFFLNTFHPKPDCWHPPWVLITSCVQFEAASPTSAPAKWCALSFLLKSHRKKKKKLRRRTFYLDWIFKKKIFGSVSELIVFIYLFSRLSFFPPTFTQNKQTEIFIPPHLSSPLPSPCLSPPPTPLLSPPRHGVFLHGARLFRGRMHMYGRDGGWWRDLTRGDKIKALHLIP